MADNNNGNFFDFGKNFNLDITNLTWSNLFDFFAAIFIIFGGVIPYIPQYQEIYKTQNADGFSIYVCFVLLVANILRIVFWFGDEFKYPLLLQSVIMIITMLAMVELCVRIKNKNIIGTSSTNNRYFFDSSDESRECLTAPYHVKLASKQFYDLRIKYFWQWTDFVSYLECLATISLVAGLAMYFFIGNYYFVQGVGYVALITEAALGLPQLYRNHVNKSTVGMNRTMVLLWLVGDVFKTIYYIKEKQQYQFWMCGFIQITIDLLILMQGFFFRSQKKFLYSTQPYNE